LLLQIHGEATAQKKGVDSIPAITLNGCIANPYLVLRRLAANMVATPPTMRTTPIKVVGDGRAAASFQACTTNLATPCCRAKTKGLLWSEQPFVNQPLQLVAGVRFELTTFGL